MDVPHPVVARFRAGSRAGPRAGARVRRRHDQSLSLEYRVAKGPRPVERGYRRLVVCHLDHKLRGAQSRADARFVERLANEFDLPIELSSADVRVLAKKTKMSIETAGRNARYQFFAEVARRLRCRTIFLGHHADDLVETFLINLFRGTGTGTIRQCGPQYHNWTGNVYLEFAIGQDNTAGF